MSIQFKDLVSLGLSRLLSQWAGKPVIQGLAKSLFQLMQPLEDAFQQINYERSIYTAVGVQLDVIGALVGESRQNRGDEAYRAAILLRISINNSDSTVNGLTGIIQSLTQDPIAYIVEHYPASAVGVANSGPNPLVPINLESAAAAGVRADCSYDHIMGTNFMFSFDTGAGIINPLSVLGNTSDNNFLSHSEDIDLGYVINPCSHGVKPTDPLSSLSIIVTDTGDTLITDTGAAIISIGV